MKQVNVLALSLCSILAYPAMAASVDVYGRADVSLQVSDEGEGSFSEVKSNASRIGFKGTHTLNDDLEVIYQAEFEVDIDGDSDDVFKGRNQFIGLKGAFGEVLLGKNDSMLKQSQGKADLFSDLNADIKVLWKGENRLSDSITYKSPKFNGFQFGASYVAEEDVDGEDAFSVAAFYGDKSLKKSTVFVSVAMDSEVGGYDTLRATVQGKVAGVTLGLMLQNQENIDTGAEMDGVMVSAKYKLGAATLKGQYQIADHKNADKNSGMTVGVDYKLAASTKLYAFYTTFDIKTENKDEDYLAAGIQYNF
ncbi:porin [Colwellia sp. MSW7]|uniref:Porin n=1 Tax=Colwellia maritima TaxID=2912588 RepID=A0ABS9X380_9GAMM|nr:porin [Colwellia maritima]MCI2284665.1 porin [Colwellia maritima]